MNHGSFNAEEKNCESKREQNCGLSRRSHTVGVVMDLRYSEVAVELTLNILSREVGLASQSLETIRILF